MAIAGSLTYDTKLDTKGFESGLNSISTKSVAIGNLIADAFKKISTHLLDVGKKAINLASDLEEVQNVVDVTFGKDAEKINKWAKEANKAFGMSELSAKKFNGTMGAMLKSMGLTGDEVLEMSTEMTGLAGDFASFYNLEHEEAFNKIRAGISGETEPLKQLGINMSVANLEAFALSQGIDKTYNSMTQAEQATLRYNYLMSVSADAQGDFARTSDSFANQQRILQLNFENLTAEVGKKLLPILNKLMKFMNDMLKDVDKVIKKFEDWLPYIEAIGIAFLSWKIGTLLQTMVTGFQTAQVALSLYTLQTNGASIAQGLLNGTLTLGETLVALFTGKITLAQLATAGLTKAQGLLNAVMSANPISLIVLAIGALIAIFVVLWNKCDGFREFWINLWDILVDAGKKAIDFIVNLFNGIINFFKENWQEILLLLINPFAGIFALLYKLNPKFKEWVDSVIQSIKNWFKKVTDIGKNIVQGIWNGITNAKDWLLNKIKSFASSITEGIKKFFKIGSPSKLMRDEVGQWLPKGIAVGIEANTDSALDSIDDMNDKIFDKMSNAVNFETGKMAFSGTTGSVSQILSSNATFDGNFVVKAEVQEGTLFEANQRITKEKRLQTGFGG